MPMETAAVGYTPVGFQSFTPAAASLLTVPIGARVALISTGASAASWRDDGGVPTATVGILVPANTTFQYTGNLAALQIICAGLVNISYYR
jgi:hypothetical protein